MFVNGVSRLFDTPFISSRSVHVSSIPNPALVIAP
jgi:hypothetical protein